MPHYNRARLRYLEYRKNMLTQKIPTLTCVGEKIYIYKNIAYCPVLMKSLSIIDNMEINMKISYVDQVFDILDRGSIMFT